jgi:hypothetical protein
MNSFGVFQSCDEMFYQRATPRPFFGCSIQVFLLRFIGVSNTGPLYNIGYFHNLIVQYFLVVFGSMMSSLGTQYWNFLLAQGFCIGFGAGCIFSQLINLHPRTLNFLELFLQNAVEIWLPEASTLLCQSCVKSFLQICQELYNNQALISTSF